MIKTINFYYKRDSLPHSEYQVRKQLDKFLRNNISSFTIITSTASIFDVVLAFCERNNISLNANYEEKHLKIDTKGVNCWEVIGWSECPDFVLLDNETTIEGLEDSKLIEEVLQEQLQAAKNNES